MLDVMQIRQVYGFSKARMKGDLCEEDGKVWGKETVGDEGEAEEQPAMESVAVDSKDVTKEGITAIILDVVSDDARDLSFWMRMHPILQVG